MDKTQCNSTSSTSKSKSSKSKSITSQVNNSNKKGFGLSNYSYADYVILSSTLSYAISEELNDEDLDFLVVFLSQVTSDLALLRTQRGYKLKKLASSTQQEINDIDATVSEGGSEDIIVSELGRGKHKYKKVKRKKIKKKKA